MIKKPIFSLSEIPETILSLSLILGIGAVFGLLVFASFELERSRMLQSRETVLPQNEYFGNKSILVKNPQKNSTIKNPAFVSGMADVHEANVRIKIKEGDNVLANTFLTAEGAGGKLYAYEGNAAYLFPDNANGSIEIFEENPKNGNDANKVIIPVVFDDYSTLIKWDSFEDAKNGYRFEYPSNLTFATNSENEAVIYHKITHRHDNLCIDGNSLEITLEDITDLHISIRSIKKNIRDAIYLEEGIEDLGNEKVKKFDPIEKNAYFIDNTQNGCGAIDYFIEIEKNKTIMIKRTSVPELKNHFDEYSSLKDIVLPTKEDHIFNRIASSIKNID